MQYIRTFLLWRTKGRVERMNWANGASLPYTTYDRLPEVDQGAIVDNKRLGRTQAIVAEVHALRDSSEK